MKRLPISGSCLCTPERRREELADILCGAGLSCNETATKQIYNRLGAIIGSWWQEQASMATEPLAKALFSLARCLQETTRLLNGHRTGLRGATEIEVTNQLKRSLVKDPALAEVAKADEFIRDFATDSEKLHEHCIAAYADLAGSKGSPGRNALGWFDDFTKLLIELARQTGVKPTIKTDRVTGEREGWLLEVAAELETFLPKEMRSPSVPARAQRLERSKKRLGARSDKN